MIVIRTYALLAHWHSNSACLFWHITDDRWETLRHLALRYMGLLAQSCVVLARGLASICPASSTRSPGGEGLQAGGTLRYLLGQVRVAWNGPASKPLHQGEGRIPLTGVFGALVSRDD